MLYLTPPSVLQRFLRGICQAARLLLFDQSSCNVAVFLGDCSPQPVLGTEDIEPIRSLLLEAGCRSFDYDFFNENLGHCGGHNRLLRDRSGSDYVLIVNPDTCVSPHVLVELLSPMADEKIGITEARQIPLEHQKSYDRATGDTSWASGACSLVRAELYDHVGLYDDAAFFMYCDDVDFSWRARLGGYRVVHQPSAVVFHDKHLSGHGAYLPSEAEKYYSALASLFIATKYSRPDIVTQRLADLDRSPEAIHERAAAEYRLHVANGTLPTPIDKDGSVAQFQTYAYANLRFDYVV